MSHWGSSEPATVLGSSPAFRRSMSVEVPELPQPMLNAQLTIAPYWLAFRVTSSPVSLVMQSWAVCHDRASVKGVARRYFTQLMRLTDKSSLSSSSPSVSDRGIV